MSLSIRSVLWFALPAAAVALGFACSDDPPPGPSEDQPATLPQNGTACDHKADLVFTYPGTATVCEAQSNTAQCTSKKWVVTAGPINQPRCPVSIPQRGFECPACSDPEVTCQYIDKQVTCGGRPFERYTAKCVEEKWEVVENPCRADAGAGDSGRD